VLAAAKNAAQYIIAASKGRTKPAVDEMGNFGPDLDYETTLDDGRTASLSGTHELRGMLQHTVSWHRLVLR
jgi:hypothetical protein